MFSDPTAIVKPVRFEGSLLMLLFVRASLDQCWRIVANLRNAGLNYSAVSNIEPSNLINDIPPLPSELRQ
jgi:hypothetical protein